MADNNPEPKSRMKPCSAFSHVLLVLVLSLTGCGKGSSAQSNRELKQAFQAAGNEAAPAAADGTLSVKAQVDQVVSALDKNDYVGAVGGLEDLKARPGLTDQQYQVLANTMVKVQGQLAQAIASGDQNAKKAGDLLRARQRR